LAERNRQQALGSVQKAAAADGIFGPSGKKQFNVQTNFPPRTGRISSRGKISFGADISGNFGWADFILSIRRRNGAPAGVSVVYWCEAVPGVNSFDKDDRGLHNSDSESNNQEPNHMSATSSIGRRYAQRLIAAPCCPVILSQCRSGSTSFRRLSWWTVIHRRDDRIGPRAFEASRVAHPFAIRAASTSRWEFRFKPVTNEVCLHFDGGAIPLPAPVWSIFTLLPKVSTVTS